MDSGNSPVSTQHAERGVGADPKPFDEDARGLADDGPGRQGCVELVLGQGVCHGRGGMSGKHLTVRHVVVSEATGLDGSTRPGSARW